MAIFSRRSLQRVIDESNSFLKSAQLHRHVNTLNQAQSGAIPTEWELVVAHAFNGLGHVIYEPHLGGNTHPDICFTAPNAKESVVIDIAVVSDKHLHKENPYDALMEELSKRLSQSVAPNLRGGFHLEVRRASTNVFRGSGPTKLRLPRRHEFKRIIFNNNFNRFLAELTASPRVRHIFCVENNDAAVTITFDPRSTGMSGSYASYTSVHSKTSNPVANSLKAKARQLKTCGFTGPCGIALCDGGCELLTRKYSDWSSFDVDEVIREFLKSHRSIVFVLTLVVRHDGSPGIGPSHLGIEGRLYLNPIAPTLDPAIQQSVANIPTSLPRPVKTPQNAQHHLDWLRETGRSNEGESFFGGLTVTGRSLKISSRAIQELLAGRRDLATFIEAHGFEQRNPFLKNLEEGRLIIKVDVEKSAATSEDDDWLIFTFGEPDAAVSAFSVRKQQNAL